MRDKSTPIGPGNQPDSRSRPNGGLRGAILVGLLCWLVFFANFRSINAGDTYPARYLPFAIWGSGTVLLDPIAGLTAQGWNPIKPRKGQNQTANVDPQEAFWVVQLPDGHTVSLYPVVAPILVAPLYLPAVAVLNVTGWERQNVDRAARIMEKVSASLVAAAGAALLYLLLLRRLRRRHAFLLTLAYAFGTTTWVISSQALWQHGTAQLLVVSALLLFTAPCSRGSAIASGIVVGLIACNRPPDALIALAFGAYGLWWAKRQAPAFVAAALLPAIPLLFYNLGVVGHLAGAYALVGDTSFFGHNLLIGIAGLLISPAKGLFIYSPFLLFLPLCVPHVLRDPATRAMGIAGLAALFLQLLIYGVADWRQGGSWGPRWLTDILPVLIWMLPPVFTRFSKTYRTAFLFAVGVSIAIEAIGAFWYNGASNIVLYATPAGVNPMGPSWNPRYTPFLTEFGHARAPFDLATAVRGDIDTIAIAHGPAGREIHLEGWAAAGRGTPNEVVMLRDGRPVASSMKFGPPASNGASGWQLTVPLGDRKEGAYRLAVLVRPYQGSDVRLVAERRVEVASGSGLPYSARLAANNLAGRLRPSGYWLTSHTTKPVFEDPGVEMNTFLPSVMVDLLQPVAAPAGVQPLLERARRFLASQIEAGGLVRYHGLPNAPTIGILGCAITPDADDTALVWRIAPGTQTSLRDNALKTLKAFQTPDGLYRTWLAPQDRYECIDRGADPNPADIAIQMHIALWLAEVDPTAAKVHCAALRRALDDDRIWVYYKDSPLIPILRQADLQAAGCPLPLPASRQRTAVPRQELWLEGARLLDRLRSTGVPAPGRAEVRQWLSKVADDDFSVMRHSPPLLYHNDPSASVSRFYWSADYGYALWLRLYHHLAGLPPDGTH